MMNAMTLGMGLRGSAQDTVGNPAGSGDGGVLNVTRLRWQRLCSEPKPVRAYERATRFVRGDLLKHPVFGPGAVMMVSGHANPTSRASASCHGLWVART